MKGEKEMTKTSPIFSQGRIGPTRGTGRGRSPARVLILLVLLFALAALAGCPKESPEPPAPPLPQYAPPVPIRQEVQVPPTLTLEDRARLSVRHLIANLDPHEGFLPYFVTVSDGKTLASRHEGWDFGDIGGRYAEALLLMREMTGERAGLEMELALRKTLMSTIGPDGLTYRQKRSWSTHEIHTADQASVLLFLTELYARTQSPAVKQRIDAMIRGLLALAVPAPGGGLRFEFPTYLKNYKPSPTRTDYNPDPIQFFARMLVPLARIIDLTGSAQAVKLYSGLETYIRGGSGIFDPGGGFDGQVHNRASAMIGVLLRHLSGGDAGRLKWVRDNHRFLLSRSSSFGWVPEVIDRMNAFAPRTLQSETCALADLLELSVLLAKSDPALWETIDCFLRNQLAQAQYCRLDWIPPGSPKEMIDRTMGSFAGYARPNSWFTENMNCCSASGAKALHTVWKRMVENKESVVYVHLSLNHLTPDVLVTSERPFRGRVTVTARRACRIALRIPDWADRQALRVNGEPFGGEWIGTSYILLKAEAPDEKWVVDYPLRSIEEVFHLGAASYKVRWKGNTVLSIRPSAEVNPTYTEDRFPEQMPPPVLTRLSEAGG